MFSGGSQILFGNVSLHVVIGARRVVGDDIFNHWTSTGSVETGQSEFALIADAVH